MDIESAIASRICGDLSTVTELNLSGLGLKTLSGKVFEKFPNVECLDLRSNCLTSLPSLPLPKLKKLNLDLNMFTNILFLKHFPSLEELIIVGNPLSIGDRYIAVALLPKLIKLDENDCKNLRVANEVTADRLRPKILKVWEDHFSSRLSANLNISQQEYILEQFVSHMKRVHCFGLEVPTAFKQFKAEEMACDIFKKKIEALQKLPQFSSPAKCGKSPMKQLEKNQLSCMPKIASPKKLVVALDSLDKVLLNTSIRHQKLKSGSEDELGVKATKNTTLKNYKRILCSEAISPRKRTFPRKPLQETTTPRKSTDILHPEAITSQRRTSPRKSHQYFEKDDGLENELDFNVIKSSTFRKTQHVSPQKRTSPRKLLHEDKISQSFRKDSGSENELNVTATKNTTSGKCERILHHKAVSPQKRTSPRRPLQEDKLLQQFGKDYESEDELDSDITNNSPPDKSNHLENISIQRRTSPRKQKKVKHRSEDMPLNGTELEHVIEEQNISIFKRRSSPRKQKCISENNCDLSSAKQLPCKLQRLPEHDGELLKRYKRQKSPQRFEKEEQDAGQRKELLQKVNMTKKENLEELIGTVLKRTSPRKRKLSEYDAEESSSNRTSPRKQTQSCSETSVLEVSASCLRRSPRKTEKNERDSLSRKSIGSRSYRKNLFGLSRSEENKSKGKISTSYSLQMILRCHSRDNDPSDCGTQLWFAAFQPDILNPGRTTNIVASCGGIIVCLIDCSTGHVMKRYKHSDCSEDFFSLAWTVVRMEKSSSTLLAVAGVNGEVILIHPSQLVAYHTFKAHKWKINCLLFHPKHATWLLTASSDKTICMWDIGIPSCPEYKTITRKMFVLEAKCEVLQVAISTTKNLVFGACNGDLLAWELKAKTSETFKLSPNYRFDLPEFRNKKMAVVDGLQLLPNDVLAVKVAGSDCIKICSLNDSLKSPQKKAGKISVLQLVVTSSLQWSGCKTEYLYLTASADGKLLACGDDTGNIWLYDVGLQSDGQGKGEELEKPKLVLPWPGNDCRNAGLEFPGNQNISVNCTAISFDAKYLVTCTDKNLACLWKLTTLD